MAPLAGPSLPPSPCGPGHVHPHIAHEDQLPQRQADSCCMTSECPLLAHHLTTRTASPFSLAPFSGFFQPCRPWWGQREGKHKGGSQEPGPAGPQGSVQEGAELRSHRNPQRRAGHRSSGIAHTGLWLDPYCHPVIR